MTEKEYNAHEGVRKTNLWKLKRSPAHYRYAVDHPDRDPSPAFIFGQAAHCLVLTPELFDQQFVVQDFDLRTKAGKEAKQAAMEAGLTLIPKDMADSIRQLADTLTQNKAVRRLLDGPHEESYFWTDEDTGELCKCRADAQTDIGGQHYIIDLKTCQDASTETFMREAIRYGYHVQAAMYADGVKAATGQDSTFVFLAIEKEAPFAFNLMAANDDFMLRGRDEYRYLMGLYHECRVRDEWPSYNGFDTEVNTLELPAWLKKEVE